MIILVAAAPNYFLYTKVINKYV